MTACVRCVRQLYTIVMLYALEHAFGDGSLHNNSWLVYMKHWGHILAWPLCSNTNYWNYTHFLGIQELTLIVLQPTVFITDYKWYLGKLIFDNVDKISLFLHLTLSILLIVVTSCLATILVQLWQPIMMPCITSIVNRILHACWRCINYYKSHISLKLRA